MRELVGSRLLGVGLAAGLAAVTVVLWLNGQLALYINPSSNWFAVPMAVIALVGAVMGQAVVWYAGQFYALFFLQSMIKVDPTVSYLLIAGALLLATPFFLFFG